LRDFDALFDEMLLGNEYYVPRDPPLHKIELSSEDTCGLFESGINTVLIKIICRMIIHERLKEGFSLTTLKMLWKEYSSSD
jgi:hypothetical protein